MFCVFPFSVSILVSHSETFLLLVFRCFEFLANCFEGNCWIVFLFYSFPSLKAWDLFFFLLLFIFPFSHFFILKQLLFICVFFPFVFSSLFSFTFCTFFLFPYFFSSSLLYPSPVQINNKKNMFEGMELSSLVIALLIFLLSSHLETSAILACVFSFPRLVFSSYFPFTYCTFFPYFFPSVLLYLSPLYFTKNLYYSGPLSSVIFFIHFLPRAWSHK